MEEIQKNIPDAPNLMFNKREFTCKKYTRNIPEIVSFETAMPQDKETI